MGYTIRDTRTHELITETVYGQKSSAKRSFNSRGLTAEKAYIADEDWTFREAGRPNLINLENFGLISIHNHFLHVSSKSTYDDFLVSYTESDIKGRRDVQSSGRKVGRYLKEFFKDLNSEQINVLSHTITAAFNKLPVEIAVTSADIASIYQECHSATGMSSCMTYSRRHFNVNDETGTSRHPTEAYGDGDLALAYIRNPDTKRISARVMIWPDKKVYNRFYGPDGEKLKSLLEKAGYSRGSFVGAKLKTIPSPQNSYDRDRAYILPYTDGDRYVYLDDDDTIRIGDGMDRKVAYRETNTGGYVTFRQMINAITGKTMKVSDSFEVRHPRNADRVYVSRSNLEAETYTSPNGTVYAKINYPSREGECTDSWIFIENVGTIPYHEARHSFFRSSFSHKWFPQDDMMDSSTGAIAMSEFIEHYARCEMTGSAILKRDLILMPHGGLWCNHARTVYATFRNGRYESRYHTSPPLENVA